MNNLSLDDSLQCIESQYFLLLFGLQAGLNKAVATQPSIHMPFSSSDPPSLLPQLADCTCAAPRSKCKDPHRTGAEMPSRVNAECVVREKCSWQKQLGCSRCLSAIVGKADKTCLPSMAAQRRQTYQRGVYWLGIATRTHDGNSSGLSTQ